MTARPLERRDLPQLVQLCREHAEYERALAAVFYKRLGATSQPRLRFTLTREACAELLPTA